MVYVLALIEDREVICRGREVITPSYVVAYMRTLEKIFFPLPP